MFYLSLCLHTLVEFPHRCTNKICTSVFCTSVCCRAMCLLVLLCVCFLVLRRICCCMYAVFCEHAAAVSVENSHCTCRSRARGGWLAGGGIIAALVLVAIATGVGTRASLLQGFRTCVLVPFTCCFHSFPVLHTQQRQRCSAATQLCSKVKGLTV